MSPSHAASQLEDRIRNAIAGEGIPASLRDGLDLLLADCPIGVSKRVDTACIRRSGSRYRIEFGEAFLQKELQKDEDLLFVLMHEVFHHVLGHLDGVPSWLRDPRLRDVANVAADILVNRAVCNRFFPGGVPLLERLYPRTHPIAALLRPPESAHPRTVRPRMLRGLRRAGWPFPVGMKAWEVYCAGWFQEPVFEGLAGLVKDLFTLIHGSLDVPLLGDHRPDRERVPGLPWDADEDDGHEPGWGDDLDEDELGDPVEPALSPELADAVRLALVTDGNNVRRHATFTPVTSPVYAPGRPDWPALSLGFWPSLFHGVRFDTGDDDLRAHVYVDVSGSLDPFLSRVYGLILALGDEVGAQVHQFSNQVVDATVDELARGVRRSTGGTDFDCVVEHALQHRCRRILVLTDGYGHIDSGLLEQWKATGASLYLVLLGATADIASMFSELPAVAKGVWELG